jgi:subtilisin family serine protease
MKRTLLFRALCLAAVAAIALSLLVLSQRGAGAQSLTRSVIVELSSDPVVVAKARADAAGQSFDADAYRQQIIAQQNDFLARLTASGVQFSLDGVNAPNGVNGEVANIQFRFNYVYNGVTLTVPTAAVPVIQKMSGVKGVHPNNPISLFLDHAVDYVRAPQLYGNPPQVHMGDSLQSGGVEGQGINIAIIDTGIDWTHPMFGGDPTPPRFGVGPQVAATNTNQKVIYYLNLTAGAVQDDFGHGTHVSGIAAGYLAAAPGPDGLPMTADDIQIHGVAPQARLMGYKVLSAVGSGASASIIMGIEDAVQPFTLAGYPKPIANVINLSLGDTTNDPDGATSVACDNATLAGVTVVAAAGNSGAPTPGNPSGEGTLGSPGTGRRVITVGAALDPGAAPNKLDELGGEMRTGMRAFPLDGSAAITSDITNNYVDCGLAETPDEVPDSVSGHIALIARGSTVNTPSASPVSAGTGLFSNKAAFATAKGAVAVVFYNNVPGDLTAATVRKSIIPTVGISMENGQHLKDAIGSTAVGAISQYQIRLDKALLFEPSMADFSSKGPVGGFQMVKPDVVAPGVNILSATVRVGGAETNTATMFDPTGYVKASGTSMATPMTAGVVALVRQKNPSWTPSMVRAAMMNTGTNLRASDGTPLPDGTTTINTQGAGLVDAYAAANAKALMGAGYIDTTPGSPTARTYGVFSSSSPGNPDFLASHSFGAVPIATVEGTATLTKTVNIYDITNGAGAGTYNLAAGNVRGVGGSNVQLSITDAGGKPVSSVDVPAGGGASFNVTVTVSGAQLADPTQIEWYLTATRADGGQRLRMPFYYRAVKPTITMAAPTFNSITGTEVTDNPPVDINGAYQLNFAAPTTGASPSKFRVQESTDGGTTWTTLADLDASQTSYGISGRGNGTYQYRVVGLFPVQYGLLAGPASAAQSVHVDRRVEQDVTSLVQAAIVDGSLSFAGGLTQFDQTLKNVSSTTLYPTMRFVITSVQSNSGKVSVANADNNGAGTTNSPAAFDYSGTVGYSFAPNALSASKHLKFNNPASEMFQFTAVVYANLPDPAYAQSTSSSGASSSSGSSTSTSGGTGTQTGTTGGLSLPATTAKVLTFTVNPLTGTVKLVQ